MGAVVCAAEVLKHHVLGFAGARGQREKPALYRPRARAATDQSAPLSAAPAPLTARTQAGSSIILAEEVQRGRSARVPRAKGGCRGQRQFVPVTGEAGIGRGPGSMECQRQAKNGATGLRCAGQCVEGSARRRANYPMRRRWPTVPRSGGEAVVDSSPRSRPHGSCSSGAG